MGREQASKGVTGGPREKESSVDATSTHMTTLAECLANILVAWNVKGILYALENSKIC